MTFIFDFVHFKCILSITTEILLSLLHQILKSWNLNHGFEFCIFYFNEFKQVSTLKPYSPETRQNTNIPLIK